MTDIRMTAEAAERIRSRFGSTSRELEGADASLTGMARDLVEACGELGDAIAVEAHDFRGSWRSVYRYCGEASALVAGNVNRMRIDLDRLDRGTSIQL